MKKLLLILITLFFWAGSSWGQTTITIGSGTNLGNKFPVVPYYGYSYTQQIILQSDIATAGQITKIRFYSNGSALTNSNNWTIYLGHTAKTAFSSNTDWILSGSMTEVYSGTVSATPAAGWFEVTLTGVFVYNNTDNLVVAVDENAAGYGGGSSTNYFRIWTTPVTNRGIYYQSDGTNPDPATISLTGTRTSYINQMQLDFVSALPCSGTPDPGNTISSSSSVCSGVNFTLSLQNTTPGSGVTYQWQSSLTGAEPWTNMGTSATQITSQTEAKYYRCEVTCDGNTGTSTAVQVTMNSPTDCYCTPTTTNGCTGDYISNVTFNGINRSSTCDGTGINYYPTPNPSLSQSVGYTLSVTTGGDTEGVKAWIDWNQDGIFDNITELVFSPTYLGTNPATYSATVTVPGTATLGSTRLRVRCSYAAAPLDPCANQSYGEAEDYLVTITAPPACPPPTAQTETNVQANSADLSWTSGASLFNVKYNSGSNFDPDVAGTSLSPDPTTTSCSLNGLSASTTYYWYVRADCEGKATSAWTGPHTFNTSCGAISSLPWSEGFETSVPPLCWTEVDVSGTAGDWARSNNTVHPSSGGVHGGSYLAYFNSYTASAGNETRLATPDLDLTSYSYVRLKFWMYHDVGYDNLDVIQIQVYTGGSWVDAGTAIPRYDGTTGWAEHTVDISAYTGGTINVGFLAISDFGNDIHIDDVLIEEIPQTFVDWNNLQWPPNATIEGYENTTVFARCWEPGVTPGAGQGAGIECWIGYSTTNSDPNTWTNWVPASYNPDFVHPDNDEYMADIGFAQALPAGTYYYASRFRLTGGPYTYGGYNAGGGGSWGGANESGVLTINPPDNDECESVTPVTLVDLTPTVFSGNNAGATISCPDGPFNSYGEVWEAFTLTYPATVVLNYCGSGGGTAWGNAWINLMTSCPCGGVTAAATYNSTACGDGNVTMTWTGLPAGTYYYPVMLDAAFNSKGAYTITVTATYVIPPANDLCAGALEVTCGNSYTGATTNATLDIPGTCNNITVTAPGVWYKFAGNDNWVEAGLCSAVTNYDSKLSVYSGSCGSLFCVTADDDGCDIPGTASKVKWLALTGTDYYILIHGYGTSKGNFELALNCITPPITAIWDGSESTNWFNTLNWDTDVPAPATNVIIPGGPTNYPTLTSAASCNNFTIQSGGSFIGSEFLTINGTTTIERSITGYTTDTDGWHLISSPVINQPISGDWTPAGGYDFYALDESKTLEYWLNQKNHPEMTNFIPGKGYLVAYDDGGIKTFTGPMNMEAVTLSGLTNTPASSYPGWHLVGNPFTSAINAALLTGTNMGTAVQVWNSGAASYEVSTTVPALNGFMIETTGSGELTIPLTSRTHSSVSWFKSTEDQILLRANDPAGHTSQLSIVRFNPEATEAYDIAFDSHYLAGFAPMFYSKSAGEGFALNTLPQLTNETVIPFEFIKNGSTDFNIELVQAMPGAIIYLTDKKTNTVTNLLDSPVYSFNSVEGDITDRFLLTFASVGIDNPNISQIDIYGYQDVIFVKGARASSEVVVTNLLGQVMISTAINGDGVNTVNARNLSDGIYLVSVISGNSVVSKKVVLQK